MGAWLVSLLLTQWRVQQVAEQKMASHLANQSIFAWDFNDWKDHVTTPYQDQWQASDVGQHSIVAKQSDAVLSLNFSGQRLNAKHHEGLLIKAPVPIKGQLRIQVSPQPTKGEYYYSDILDVEGSEIIIDLNGAWHLLRGDEFEQGHYWGQSFTKISSVVLYFTGHSEPVIIDAINFLQTTNIAVDHHDINCQGQLLHHDQPHNNDLQVFTLANRCYLPSNYLWLQDHMNDRYPGSIVRLREWGQAKQPFQLHAPFWRFVWLDVMLYVFMLFALVWTAIFTHRYTVVPKKHESIVRRWIMHLGKVAGFHVVRPYHLLLNYAWVMLPSLVVFLVLCWLKWPSIAVFKSLPMYFLWALVQQFLLVRLLADGLFYQRLGNRFVASGLAAMVFAMIHLPSVTLMLATFFAGCFWAFAGLLFNRLLPLALSHAILALMFYHVVPERVLYSAKVLQWFWS